MDKEHEIEEYWCTLLAGGQWLLLLANTGHAAMFLITPIIVGRIFMTAKSTKKMITYTHHAVVYIFSLCLQN